MSKLTKQTIDKNDETILQRILDGVPNMGTSVPTGEPAPVK